MNVNYLAAGAVMVVLVGVMGYFLFNKDQNGVSVNGDVINFKKIGYVARNNPGFKPDVWYLNYDLSKSPGSTKELLFDDTSFLYVNEKSHHYNEGVLYNGLHVSIEGYESNGIVQVKYLSEIPDIEPPVMTAINLYYYNPEKDKDASGNLLCSRQGLVPVIRKVPITFAPIQHAIKLLLQGQVTPDEVGQGVGSEYPLAGFELKGASLNDRVLTLEFLDPQGKTVGGACRVGVLWFQIEATAKQFSGVDEVRFIPEELFQP